ncbi:hypothetical protein NC652_037218 [Populus alba x Populus x berolinensis]|nr:hypothetical protein NC652_037218 [Populus alba x Populus x berolinensis]
MLQNQNERSSQLFMMLAGSIVMPDAMETIFQSALYLGRIGGVDELMGDLEKAALLYSKAVRLLVFLLGGSTFPYPQPSIFAHKLRSV